MKERSRRDNAEIERAATRMYDRLNPEWDRHINVSKADCIKIVKQRRKRRAMLRQSSTPNET